LPDQWSRDDAANAAHLMRAFRASGEAWAICEKAGYTGRPWLMNDADRLKFARLLEEANREARRASPTVLARMHEGLPGALDDFIAATSRIPANVTARTPDTRVQALWAHWTAWWTAHHSEVRFPRGQQP
jgi:hypothetical protein